MVSGSQSHEGTGSGGETHPPSTYTETFYEQFPRYLAMGMTYEQYWDGDPMLCKYYREAEELRNDQKNQELWVQGLYIYQALLDASPVLRAFAKKGTKPNPYPTKPFPLTAKAIKREKEEEEKERMEKGLRYMNAMMAAWDAKRKTPKQT